MIENPSAVSCKHSESGDPYHSRLVMKRLFILLLFASALAAEPRKFIVEFTSGAAARSASATRFRTDAAQVAVVRHEFSRVFHGAAVELRDGQSVEALRQLPNIAAVVPDGEVIAFSATPLPASSGAQRFHHSGTNADGTDVVVAIIDTGVDGSHPALAGKVIGGHDFVNDDDDATDDHGHGTHVSGIIAAQSQLMTGIAPGAHLLAYKVLNAEGRGTASDVIAAIERSLDPNGDGDPSDRADIINLSLGDRGRPDDPLTRAVDNAVAAGVVVCAAAGNDGAFHRIGSPAGAANAITVGASSTEDGVTVVAYFSSRGPATGSAAIKPDLLAPGHDIFSTGLNHGYMTLSGTSMATPYVAGLAALLLEEHPDWTPARIKAALVTTARWVDGEEVMTQGAGFADLQRARANSLAASPSHVSFGLDGATSASWTSTRRITLRNDGAEQRTVHAALEGETPAIALTVTPPDATLAPGASADFDVTVTVDHSKLGAPDSGSFAFSGMLLLQSNGQEIRLPWAFVRAARATITSDGGVPNVFWYADEPTPVSAVRIGANGMELLCTPGTLDFVITSTDEEELRIVVAERRQIAGDVALDVTAADAPYEIRFAAGDERGAPFPDGDQERTIRSLLLRLILPDQRTMPLPDITGRVVRASAFSARFGLLGIEAFVDRDAARVYVAQHPPVREVGSNRLLQTSPGDYASQEVALTFPAGPRREIGILPRDLPRRPREHRPPPQSLRFAVDAPTWNGTLFLTKEVLEDVAGGVQLSLFTDAGANASATIITPTIRRNDDGFFVTWGYVEKALPVYANRGETMSFGRGVIHVPFPLRASEDSFSGDAEVFGDRGDQRRTETVSGTVRVVDDDGHEVGAGAVTPGGFVVPLAKRGRLTATIRFPAFVIDDRSGEAMLTTRFDTTAGIASMPAVTSLAVLDGAGQHATRLALNGNGSILFSAADYELATYRRVVASATKVFFRMRNAPAWTELTAVATGDEETTDQSDRWPSGLVYRVDLHDALRTGPGEYEIAIEIADEQGNTTRWQLAPAFIVEPQTPLGGRRRAVGK